MSEAKRALLLIGSAKEARSTSESLGTHLLDRLRRHGFESDVLFVHQSLKSQERTRTMLAAVRASDVLVLAFPLYVDSLPFVVTRALELIAADCRKREAASGQRLLGIVNCGFPEAHHTDTALAICRQFAREAGFVWAGGLGLGGGEAIGGKPLSEAKGLARNVIRALDQAADAVAGGRPVPEEAAAAMARPLVPKLLYTWLGSRRWKQMAKEHGALDKLHDRPY